MNHESDYSNPEGEEEEEDEEEEEEDEEEEEEGEEEEEEGERKGGGGIMMPPTKIPRTQSLDRISALHDSVLLHILSFLPMEDVVGTGTLSRRWQYLWTSTSTLVFKREMYHTNDIDKFVASVNGTLLLCRCSNIKKFVLHLICDYHESFPPDVNRWIRFSTQNNVDDLDLKFGPHAAGAGYSLPQHLFTNSSLRILSASGCDIEILPSVQSSWISLKSLTFDSVWLRDGAIAKILSGCPVLEIFNMKRVNAFGPLDINSASLKKLVIEQCVIGDGEDVLKISAPNLQLLALSGNFLQCRFRLVNVSAIVKANLGYYGGCSGDNHDKRRSQLLELLERIEHVKELHLWDWCIQVLSVDDVRGLPSPMSSCKMLTLHTHVTKWDIHGIASVLQSLPYIEKLVVDLSSLHHEFLFCKNFISSCNSDGKNPWASCKRTCAPFMHLKTIEIVGFKEVDEETVLPLMQILLLSAMVLEKMVIKIGKSGYKQCSKCTSSGEFVRLTHKLLSFPRASPRAAILFA